MPLLQQQKLENFPHIHCFWSYRFMQEMGKLRANSWLLCLLRYLNINAVHLSVFTIYASAHLLVRFKIAGSEYFLKALMKHKHDQQSEEKAKMTARR